MATTLYDESQRTRVIGIYAALTAVGAALGPVVGGLLIEVFGWRVVFWMRAPIAIAALALSWTIPNRQRSEAIGGFDFVGAGLLVVWLVTLLLALALRTEMAGFEVRLMLLGVAGVTFGVWLRHERRHPEPIIRPALFRDVGFTFVNVVSVIVNYAAFSILLLVPYFLVRTAGLSAGAGGAVLALAAVGTVIGAWLAGRLAGGIATTKLVAVGLLLSLAGLTGIAHWTAATALGHIGLALLVQGLGVGLFNVAYTDLVTATLPLRDRGVAGSLTMVTRTLGVVAGATLHAQIQQVSQSAAQLAGATAEQAFVAGFQAAFVAAALVLAGGLMLCVVQLARSGVGARTL